MEKNYGDKKFISYVSAVALLVYSLVSFIGACLCVIGKKKTTASIFIALAGISAAMGGVLAYTLKVFERTENSHLDDFFEDFDEGELDDYGDEDEDEDDVKSYNIPVDETASEDEFKD